MILGVVKNLLGLVLDIVLLHVGHIQRVFHCLVVFGAAYRLEHGVSLPRYIASDEWLASSSGHFPVMLEHGMNRIVHLAGAQQCGALATHGCVL